MSKNVPVVLLGNGINRCFGLQSWNNIVEDLTKKYGTGIDYKSIENMPFPMQVVATTGDKVDIAMKSLCVTLRETRLKDEGLRLIRKFLADASVDVLTTNYSFEIENALGACPVSNNYRPFVKYTKYCTKKDRQFSLFKYFDVGGRRIWHIHGDAGAPSSVIMGQYYYGKALKECENN